LTNEAMLLATTGRPADALRAAQQAEAMARATADPTLRARELADVATATGAALAETDPRAAGAPLTRAIDYYRQHELPLSLPEPLLLRARCAMRAGDTPAAMRDLDEGIAIVERRRAGTAETASSASVLEPEHALFADAIRLRLDRGEPAAAFAYAERSRGGSITSAELQRRLAGSGVAVLEIVALPSDVVTFAIAANDLAVGRRPRARATLRPLAGASLSENDTTAAAALYDDLIRPVDALLARASGLIIVPDPRLQSVPFAALYDAATRRYLIERFPVAIASSATSLQRASRQAIAPSLAAIALPSSGATNAAALPDAARETGEIAALYRRAETIEPAGATLNALQRAATRADVLHIAGHTEAETGGGEQALLLAGSAGKAIERISWKTIVAAPRIRAGTVVLAACETLRPPASAATQTISLGQAFATAGAADVIGTLAPIGDRDARLLFAALHRRIAAGERPADALRAAQQEAIAKDPEHRGRRAWRAVALLTTRIPV
jgi:CHAT domain-containing protein